jgi:transcriptional regulator GlxA family with amidase domain
MAELYLRARLLVERGYRQQLTLAGVARALPVSPRQLERAYDEIGLTTFAAHRLRNAAELLAHQPSHFVKVFRRR